MKENKKALKFFAGFLVLMLIMTFVSRIVYTRRLPVVTAQSAKSQRLTNVLSCPGSIEPTAMKSVYLPEGLTVEMVSAFAGKKTAEGDELLRLDLDKLKEKTRRLKAEIAEEKQTDAAGEKTGTSVFTEPDMPVKSISVRVGDKVEKGDELFRIDTDRLCSFINELETDRNNDIINRSACTEARKKAEKDKQDETAAQQKTQEAILNGSIAQKQRRIDRYMRVLNSGGRITAPCGGVITSVKISSGENTASTAAMLIGEKENVSSALMEKERLLDEYRKLIKSSGIVTSSINGTVTAVDVAAGQLTTSGAAVNISDDSAPLYFRAELTEEQARKIAAGDRAELSFRNGRIRLDTCTVESVTKLASGSSYRADVPVESSDVVCGETGQLRIRLTDEEPGVCVPKSAVKGGNNSRYVYMLVTEEGFLGEEYRAERVSVSEQNSNENYVSLSAGVSEGEYVICTEKELTDGQAVRLRTQARPEGEQ